MHKFINEQLKSLDWSISPKELYLPIGYALESGGKRIRPALVLMACELFGGDKERAVGAAMAIEVFHNFTLLHDDIMDNAETRRNRLTVHKKWDANTAILSGDAMMIKSYEFLEQTPVDSWSKIFPIFTRTALEVCEGQQYDMNFELCEEVTLDEYFNMIRLKTAVLLGAALQIGAILGGASNDDAQNLYDFGIAIGIAFQLRDDYLDTYGNENTFGKRIGGDILCGKKTFLLINALQNSEIEGQDKIKKVLMDKTISEQEKIDIIASIYNKLRIPSLCEEAMADYYHRALESLSKISGHKIEKEPFTRLAQQLMGRTD